ncbi:hypothetical protein PVT68_00760 [Microbulbifer bruguierae]|uniref:Uncharacterized protein n=1 Tax=Microbulbifer bruguierae TaxID=3029061 RepID=A0ABY8ND44_9GAMM|nr:hypothetical protein [Microbulbifer bruguierae]WGL16846.1 hypothetical protein PVT68_00760 [Microbulbifer bruguierae]
MNCIFGSSDDALIASGRYEYFLDRELQPIEERWRLYRRQRKLWLDSERYVSSISLRLSARAELVQGEITRCLVSWVDSGLRVSSAIFTRESDSSARYFHRPAGQPARSYIRSERVFFPLLRVYTGLALGGILSRGADTGSGHSARVLIPWIKDPAQKGKLLEPSTATRTAIPRQCSFPVFPDHASNIPLGASLDCYQYSGEQYGDDTRFWVADGLLHAYRWNQAGRDWMIRLTDMQGQWPGRFSSSLL